MRSSVTKRFEAYFPGCMSGPWVFSLNSSLGWENRGSSSCSLGGGLRTCGGARLVPGIPGLPCLVEQSCCVRWESFQGSNHLGSGCGWLPLGLSAEAFAHPHEVEGGGRR